MNAVAPTFALACARIGLGVAALMNTWEARGVLLTVADGGLHVPVLEALPAPAAPVVWTLTAIGVIAAFSMLVGRWTTTAAITSAAVTVLFLLWDQQVYTNHHVLTLLLVLWLSLTGVGATHARTWTGQARAWAPVLMMVQLSVCYMFAGLSKVNGPFLTGRAFDTWLRWDLPDVLTGSIALGTIVAELFLAVGLWFRWSRPLAAAVGVGLHLSIVVMMASATSDLVAFSFASLSVYPLFFAGLVPKDRGEADTAIPAIGTPRAADSGGWLDRRA